jgi:hypothetical protein
MRTWKAILVAFAALVLATAALSGCSDSDGGDNDTPGTTLVDADVTVPAGGGASTVFFRGEAGKTIRITLTGPATTAPYGFLEPPGGDASYTPPNNGSSGTNEADVTLLVTGEFSLTIFDGNNNGGVVHVLVRTLT